MYIRTKASVVSEASITPMTIWGNYGHTISELENNLDTIYQFPHFKDEESETRVWLIGD